MTALKDLIVTNSMVYHRIRNYLTLYDKEPTRSITFRSAASLAMQCGKYLEAEKLITQGLDGNPPADIAQELRDLYAELKDNKIQSKEGISEKSKNQSIQPNSKTSKAFWISGILLVANGKEKNSFVEVVFKTADTTTKGYSEVC